MTSYPLPTLTATVTSTGITAPSYNDILLSLQASYAQIYGSDVSTDPSDQDVGWLAILAAAINDSNQVAVAIYNGFSPSTAVGAGLSSVVKVNGIRRLVPSASTAAVVIGGPVGTSINNGQVGDNAGLNTVWNLPASVGPIPLSGELTVTATCATTGAVTAAANTLTNILTPTAGWQTVTNPEAAAVGQPVETDAQLRIRQTQSTSLPSVTTIAGIVGAIEDLTGAVAVSYDDNDTDFTDVNGVPAHTLSMVVEGGDLQSIVNIIGEKITIGAGTYGNTSGTYVDPVTGVSSTINFSIPAQITILVAISVTPLPGYSSAVTAEIQGAIASYIDALGIGADVLLTRLYAPALLQGPFAVVANANDPTSYELESLLISISPAPPAGADLPIAYNQMAVCTPGSVSVTVL